VTDRPSVTTGCMYVVLRYCLTVSVIYTIIKTTSAGNARLCSGKRGCRLAGDTDGLAGWGVVEVGVVDTRYGVTSQEQTLSGTDARVYTAHRGWLGVVTGISATSTGGERGSSIN